DEIQAGDGPLLLDREGNVRDRQGAGLIRPRVRQNLVANGSVAGTRRGAGERYPTRNIENSPRTAGARGDVDASGSSRRTERLSAGAHRGIAAVGRNFHLSRKRRQRDGVGTGCRRSRNRKRHGERAYCGKGNLSVNGG